jgi:uncharacterized protein (DUF4213/DUF364 family)
VILEKIYQLALPKLKGKKIKDVTIGLALMAVELDDGSIGVTYVLRKETDDICTAIPRGKSIVGRNAEEVAIWAVENKNVISSALGLAVLNSVAEFDEFINDGEDKDSDAAFSIKVTDEDTVGIIGNIGPVVSNLRGKVKEMFIFERGDKSENLPECQVVFITSSTLINGTFEKILSYCTNTREIVMVGSSTPIYPEAFKDSRVTVLAGTKWLPENKDAIFTDISQCAGMRQLIKCGKKVSAKVI